MRRRDNRRDESLHHIIGKVYHNRYNVDMAENKIILKKKKHEAFNTVFECCQAPKQQLDFLFKNYWLNVLSEETKTKIIELLNTKDEQFYIRRICKDGKAIRRAEQKGGTIPE